MRTQNSLIVVYIVTTGPWAVLLHSRMTLAAFDLRAAVRAAGTTALAVAANNRISDCIGPIKTA
jgi:hypothetical protein